MTSARLEAAADKLEIIDLSSNYMRGLDRLDGELERSVFWDDAWCSYGTYEGGPDDFVEFCMMALKTHAANHHFLGQINIDLDGDEAWGEVYYQAFHRTRNEAGEDRDLFISGRYVDRYERREGTWKIAYRSELVDWVREEAAADDWFIGSAMIVGARKPDDPLYDRAAMQKKKYTAKQPKVTSKLDPELLRAYAETDYIVSDDPPLVLHVAEQNDDARILLASFGVTTAAFLTAWNPRSEKLSEDENLDRQMELLSEIEARRLNYLVGYGERGEWREYSYLILGIDRQDASELALQFEQNAYVWLDDAGVPALVTLR